MQIRFWQNTESLGTICKAFLILYLIKNWSYKCYPVFLTVSVQTNDKQTGKWIVNNSLTLQSTETLDTVSGEK